MKQRYEDHFTYWLDTGNCNLNVKTPRLIIQPLAENCFRHGFSNTEPPWHIRVRVYSDEKMWYAEIVDNGGGIPPESVDQVNRNVERFFEHPQQEMERLASAGWAYQLGNPAEAVLRTRHGFFRGIR